MWFKMRKDVEIQIKDSGRVIFTISEPDPIVSIAKARSYVKSKYGKKTSKAQPGQAQGQQ
jgi:hypothetical protein